MQAKAVADNSRLFNKVMLHCTNNKLPLGVVKFKNSFFLIGILSSDADAFKMIELGRKFKCLASPALVDFVVHDRYHESILAISDVRYAFSGKFFENMLAAVPGKKGFNSTVSSRSGKQALKISPPFGCHGLDNVVLAYPLNPDSSNVTITNRNGIKTYSPAEVPTSWKFNFCPSHNVESGVFAQGGKGYRNIYFEKKESAGVVTTYIDADTCKSHVVKVGPLDKIVAGGGTGPCAVLGALELPDKFMQLGLKTIVATLSIVQRIIQKKQDVADARINLDNCIHIAKNTVNELLALEPDVLSIVLDVVNPGIRRKK